MGTLAEKGDRSPFDYSKVIEDTPIEPIVELSKILSRHYTIIVCSGREDVCYNDTKSWLDKYGIQIW